MSNPSGPDRPKQPAAEGQSGEPTPPGVDQSTEQPTEQFSVEHATEQFSMGQATEQFTVEQPTAIDPDSEAATEVMPPPAGERRFTAPSGFDAGSTQKIDMPTGSDPATEVFSMPPTAPSPAAPPGGPSKLAGPQVIPPRGEGPEQPGPRRRSWGWVIAVVLIILALVALAVLGTVLLTRDSKPKASQEDMVRSAIMNFDTAIQNGDLTTLRTITCGTTRENYVNYDDREWAETHARVAAAKQYPVVASIDQVAVHGDQAEANVTSFMAFAPQTRSTRSFDLQFSDDEWKICQAG